MDGNNLQVTEMDTGIIEAVEPVQVEDALAVGLAVVDGLKLAVSTKRNYRRSWRAWCKWCPEHGWTPWMPSGSRLWSFYSRTT